METIALQTEEEIFKDLRERQSLDFLVLGLDLTGREIRRLTLAQTDLDFADFLTRFNSFREAARQGLSENSLLKVREKSYH
jgi:hypothetical protein